jgi:hypothetical protein
MLAPNASVAGGGLGQAARPLPSLLVHREYDFRSYPAQPLPGSATEMQILMAAGAAAPSTVPAPTALFRFDATGLDPDLDLLGGEDINAELLRFEVASPEPVSPKRGRRAVGLLGGSPWHSSFEIVASAPTGTHRMFNRAGPNGDEAPGAYGGSWAFVYVFRATDIRTGSPTEHVISCEDTDGVGWRVELLSSSSGTGRQFVVRVHVEGVTSGINLTVATLEYDEAWHALFVRYDDAAEEVTASLDGDTTGVTASTAGIGSIVPTTDAYLCAGADVFGYYTPAPHQGAYFAWWQGGAGGAEDLTLDHFDAFWRLERLEGGGLPSGISYTRTNRVGHTIRATASGDEVVCYPPNRPAYRRGQAWGGIVLATHPSVTNMFSNAYLVGWAATNATLDRMAGDAPTGCFTAAKITSTGTNGRAFSSVSLTSGVTYTFSVWLNVDTAGTVNLFRESGGVPAVYQAKSIVPTEFGVRHSYTFTATTTAFYTLAIVAPAGSHCYAWGAQIRAGSAPGPLALCTETTETVGATAITHTPGGGATVAVAHEGGLYAEFECDAQPAATQYAVACYGGNDKRMITVETGSTIVGLVYDSAPALRLPSPTVAAKTPIGEHRLAVRLQWDENASLPGGSSVDGSQITTEMLDEVVPSSPIGYDGETDTFSTAATMTTIAFGQSNAGANHLEGGIRFVRTFAGVE